MKHGRERRSLRNKNEKKPKIIQYFKNEDYIDEEGGGNEDIDVTKSSSIAEADNSECLDPEQPQLATSKTQSVTLTSKNLHICRMLLASIILKYQMIKWNVYDLKRTM